MPYAQNYSLTLFCLVYVSLGLQPLTTTLALIGKAGAAGSFGLVYLFTSEIMPTVVRNGGLGLCSALARAGAMVAPYIAKSVSSCQRVYIFSNSAFCQIS